jgi:hypothetical protein
MTTKSNEARVHAKQASGRRTAYRINNPTRACVRARDGARRRAAFTMTPIELALIGCLLAAPTAVPGPAAGFAVQAAADTARHHFRPARRNPG